MSSELATLASLRQVHLCRGRVRWHYRRSSGQPLDCQGLSYAIADLAGVLAVRFNPKASSLVISFDWRVTEAQTLAEQILALTPPLGRIGFTTPAPAAVSRTRLATNLAALLGVNLLPVPLRLPLSLLMALPVLRHGAGELVSRGLTSHVLEGMAVSISLGSGDYLAANTTSFMLELGEYLEESISRRSDDMLRELLKPASDEIWVERGGVEILVPASEVEVGETVIVATGMVIQIDGTVLGGEAYVNEASMTGESRSVAKARGDAVMSGTVLEDGRLRIYAEHVGQRTAAARIADYVQQSLTAKSEVQLQASQLADKLVPRVLGLAGSAFLLSGDWRRAAAVLQADYSCALKLATPVAFKSAMYAAGKGGILIKGATALERLAEADTFIFDKTGTLTNGDLVVTDSVTFDSAYTADDLIWLAASVEEHYFHPLAIAVVEASRNIQGRHFDHTEVEFIVAHGVASEIDGKRIVVGSRHFVEEDEGIDVSPWAETLHGLYLEGKTLLYIGYGGSLIGVLALRDTVREQSAATLARLRQSGVKRILMLTGDHHDRAQDLADQLGIDEVFAQLLPEEKASIIEQLTSDGSRIAFVGDGINDAPALAGAHVGIAMQKGADIARISADIALLQDDISRVADARELACAAMGLIHDNYRITIGANTAILGAAAVGLLSPIVASVLHNGTTIGILLNALRGRH
ncbi:heavy metal translocating P-type ATPase [Aeromonas lusitana]|uniref:P-type Zn(2+) transporter n=1 Tax=Aeromonas lusitana TaxID=931529 RepID=A0A2M8HCA9_9GAMM|nr:heavy metal translocating P-type ATPase [Aeromonas lusitana]PJC94206.1 heavy metal translocating P-type ATPase [Aeromonas lusitana]